MKKEMAQLIKITATLLFGGFIKVTSIPPNNVPRLTAEETAPNTSFPSGSLDRIIAVTVVVIPPPPIYAIRLIAVKYSISFSIAECFFRKRKPSLQSCKKDLPACSFLVSSAPVGG